MMAPTCGAPDCTSCGMVEPGCGAPAGGGLMGAAQRGGCLGLGCFGKIFSIAGYGCSTPIYGNNGCGEAYYHDWINEPPCADPCDGCGNWTGIASGGVCGSCSGATAMDPTCGMADPVCGAPADPVCGVPGAEVVVDSCDGGCGGGACGIAGHRNAFQLPGRALYSTWTGVGGLLRGLRGGLFPTCRTCNAFSFSESCVACGTAGWPAGSVVDPSGGCSSCASTQPVGQVIAHRATGHATNNLVAAGTGKIPHEIVSKTIKTAHSRPPHKVLTKRLR